MNDEIGAKLQTLYDAVQKANDEEPQPELKVIADTAIELIGGVLSDFKRIADAVERCVNTFEEYMTVARVLEKEDLKLAEVNSQLSEISVRVTDGSQAIFPAMYARGEEGQLVLEPKATDGWRFWREDASGWNGERVMS